MPESPKTTIKVPSAAANPPVAFFKRTSKGKSTFRKRPATPPPASSSDSSSASDTDEGGDGNGGAAGRIIKKRKTATVSAKSADLAAGGPTEVATAYDAKSKAIITDAASEATRGTYQNWYDDPESALLGRKKPDSAAGPADDAPAEAALDGTYKGVAAYGNFVKKTEKQVQATKAVGPLKAPTNIRTITITDYAPDVCKDYKQTGFCGFGDTCKFLHAREDYAAGWKLDRDWELGKDGKRKDQKDAETEEDKELKSIPFKCVICKDDYRNPIVTKCSHYFCEACAIRRYKKNPGCAICGKRTDGVFNGAKNLQRLLDRKRVREEKGESGEGDDEKS